MEEGDMPADLGRNGGPGTAWDYKVQRAVDRLSRSAADRRQSGLLMQPIKHTNEEPITDVLREIRKLAMVASDPTLSPCRRAQVDARIRELVKRVDSLATPIRVSVDELHAAAVADEFESVVLIDVDSLTARLERRLSATGVGERR